MKHLGVFSAMLLAALVMFSSREAAGLDVNVSVTIEAVVSIAWGDFTSMDDLNIDHPAGTTDPFNWTVNDGTGPALSVGGGPVSSADNGKMITVRNTSATGTNAAVSGAVYAPLGWSVASLGPDADTFAIGATLGTTSADLDSGSTPSLGSLAAGPGNDLPLVLTVTPPTSVTIGAGSPQVISVALTATVAP